MRRPRISVVTALAVVAFLLHCPLFADATRTKHQIYMPLKGSPCIRRLNATHSVGCSSAFGGSIGVLHHVATVDDFAFVSRSPPAPPYVLIVPTSLFTGPNIRPLLANRNVSGILLYDDPHRPDVFSGELRCPNQHSSYNNETCNAADTPAERIWHPTGSGLMYESFPFPVHLLDESDDAQSAVECYRNFNRHDPQESRPLCSAQIDSFMTAGGNAARCKRRSADMAIGGPICDALSGYNVFATLFPRPEVDRQTSQSAAQAADPDDESNSTESLLRRHLPVALMWSAPPATDEKFIIVTARLDTASMFDALAPGHLEVLALVTMCSVAHTLRLMLPERLAAGQPNVLFVALQGEAFDYIGSSSLSFELLHGAFPPQQNRRQPIDMRNVLLIVDLADLNTPTRLHSYQVSAFQPATDFLAHLQQNNEAYGLNVSLEHSHVQASVPPSSVHAFLRHNASAPVLVLRSPTDNVYLHSIYDDNESLEYQYAHSRTDFDRLERVDRESLQFDDASVQMAVRNVSTVLAKSLYHLITGRPHQGALGANAVLIDELLYCYLGSTSCELMRAALPADVTVEDHVPPPMRYVGVNPHALDGTTRMALELFSVLLGRLAPDRPTAAECAPMPWVWVKGRNGTGECRETTSNVSVAESPAFWLKEYDMQSGQYSTWTESRWREVKVRLFLKPTASHEALTLAIGFVVTMISLVGVFLINSRSDVLFDKLAIVGAETMPEEEHPPCRHLGRTGSVLTDAEPNADRVVNV